jgi:hypothetical protein
MFSKGSTEIRLLGIIEESLIKGYITRRDDLRLEWDLNSKNVCGVVANEIADESAFTQLLLS